MRDSTTEYLGADLGHHADELERFNNLSINREVQMVELKREREMNALLKELGRRKRYPLDFEKG